MFCVGGILMNSKTLSNFHKFGKVGKIAMTVLMVIAILAAAASCVATIFVSALPKDALTVRVTNHAEFRINGIEILFVDPEFGMIGNANC